ncbi:bifunctional UDP-2,4-diacetamido-2,4,6-trideoxy-beta-L-altropyranose hydrolase/GNAT family N-acetyltransferase [Actinophytocola oryzae]|uniref:Spore coat polysaccharide biosynthesis predicted glycosyltransferase SpsG n=1 Tax=Actinophytocola oryzae TaxID=502181 RepID=A0A4R7VNT4_9PSEU|nr:spore coat polysaccharide biosynthesis predicted glycosyltransferase SpsG [Actinophytocola oryzae]
MTSLLLRADAAPTTGVGHLSRCVALATAARERGWDVALCGSFTAGEWLIGDLEVVPALEPADVVLIDHYGLGQLTLPSLVVSMEDGTYGRRRADIVVDANIYTSPRPDDGSPVVLRGPAYAPLRREIRAARAARRGSSTPPRVVVVMGGGAAPSSVAAAVTAIRETGVPADVVAISSVPVSGVDVVPPTPDLPTLFAEADLVVSAAGVTLLELCCVGVPAALVQIADNQAAGYEAATTQGLAAGLGTDPREHVATLKTLLLREDRRKALADRATATVDGQGADRVITAIETRLHESPTRAPGGPSISSLSVGADISVRSATVGDSADLLVWRNDPETRAWSRTTDLVATEDHEAWLARVLDDPDRHLLIAVHGTDPVGTVRFDRDGEHWEVSITVAPRARGRKLAVPMLLAAERTVHGGLRACVHRDNRASTALFERAGYRHDRTDGQWVWFAKSV